MKRNLPIRSATVAVDAARVSVARSLAVLARSSARDGGPLVVVSHRALDELADELGSYDAAARHLLKVATNVGRPLAVNYPTGSDSSQTLFISPKDWSQERLAGWAAGRREELERMFGPATPLRVEGGERDE